MFKKAAQKEKNKKLTINITKNNVNSSNNSYNISNHMTFSHKINSLKMVETRWFYLASIRSICPVRN
jgi:hypothetical protein